MSDTQAVQTGPAPETQILEPAANTVPATVPASANQAAANTAPATEGELGEKGRQEVINLRKRAQRAEANEAYFRGLAEGRGAQSTPQTQVAQGPPNIDQFENYDDFVVAKAKYEIQQDATANRGREHRATVQKTWQERLAKEAEKDPDIISAIQNPNVPITDTMSMAIMESEAGPKVARFLVDNMAEAARISYLSPYAQAREIGKIEARLTATSAAAAPPSVNLISQAPEPVKSISSVGSLVTTDLDKIPVEEFMSKRNAESRSRR